MDDRDPTRPEHESGVPSTASDSTPNAPDEPVAGFEAGNDPTGSVAWIRRRFRLASSEGAGEALEGVLAVPGVARAALERDRRELVADIEPGVISDDELAAAAARGGVEIESWSDEEIPRGVDDASRRRNGNDDAGRFGDIVDEQGDESFPASDAPSSWARSPDDAS
jgi:hypothetical protein